MTNNVKLFHENGMNPSEKILTWETNFTGIIKPSELHMNSLQVPRPINVTCNHRISRNKPDLSHIAPQGLFVSLLDKNG